jgi:hypothetical protein
LNRSLGIGRAAQQEKDGSKSDLLHGSISITVKAEDERGPSETVPNNVK